MARKFNWHAAPKVSRPEVVRAWAESNFLKVDHAWPLCFCVLFKAAERRVVHALLCGKYADTVFDHSHKVSRFTNGTEATLSHPYYSGNEDFRDRMKVDLERLDLTFQFSASEDPYYPNNAYTFLIHPSDWGNAVALPQGNSSE